jgi:sortase A
MMVGAAPGAMRRVLRAFSTAAIIAGLALIADAVLAVVWQEPLTALVTESRQDGLAADLRRLERAGPTPAELAALVRLPRASERVAFLARSLQHRAAPGQAIGRIRIPRIGIDFVLVNGSGPDDLRRGPGLYDGRPFPGDRGTVAIAGHRTWFQAPFRHIDRLRAGDAVQVDMPYARLTYIVEGHDVVSPRELGVLRRMLYDRLVLSACHPLGSAARRWVVFARLQVTVVTDKVATAGLPRRLSSHPQLTLTPARSASDTGYEPQRTTAARGGAQ